MPYEKAGPNDPVCIADEVPFDIPDTWEWIRLGSICEIARGGSPRPINQFLTDSADGINWIKIGDSDKGGKFINSTKEKIIPEAVSRSRLVHAGDFLLTNSMSFGRPYILNIDGCIHDGWLVLSGFQHCYNKDFLFYLLSSTFAYSQFCGVVSGAVVKNLNRDKVAGALFPLPPLAEQQRLVAKIEELLPYIENYDRAEQKLDKLNTEFPEQLKKSILQWAIQGKLLPQNPNDEPASVLLERIRAEKAKLIKEGKIKKDKEESVIFRRDNSHYEKLNGVEHCIDDEIPFEIPDSWEWARCGIIFQVNPRNTVVDDVMVGFIPMPLLQDGFQSKHSFEIKRWKDVKRGFTHFRNNDIVIAKITSCFQNRKSAVVANLPNKHGAGTTELHVLRDNTNILYMNYFLWIFKSHLFIEDGKKNFTGTAGQQRIGKDFVSDFLLPIPPVAEQKRIVEAIELLFCKLSV